MFLVLAVRQPLSAPTWAKPIVMGSSPPPLPESELLPHAVSEMVPSEIAQAATRLFFSTVIPLGSPGFVARCDGCHSHECER